ncbi:MAG: hypothetical protein ACRYG4_22860 [Janthinobacterium lividum]
MHISMNACHSPTVVYSASNGRAAAESLSRINASTALSCALEAARRWTVIGNFSLDEVDHALELARDAAQKLREVE